MKPEEIIRAYEQLSAAPLSFMLETPDQSIVIYDEDGLRIVLSRISELVQLDVEVSKPQLETTDSNDLDAMTEKCRVAALKSISYLQFLVHLTDYGFTLSMDESEFLWIASVVFNGPPSHSLLELFRKPLWFLN
jgi:hypothetical protein